MKKVSRPKLIGLITDPSPDVLVGLFGILKSGNGFVPIPPSTPIERIRFIIADCRIEMLVTESKYLDKLLKVSKGSPSLKHIICLDAADTTQAGNGGVRAYDCRDFTGPAPDRTKTASTPDELLYVIYTSGSTGMPKGVPITHRNLAPLMFWSEQYFQLGEHTRVLQNLSYGFDFGIFELLTTVIFGGTLFFVKPEDRGDLSRYADQIKRYEIDTIHTTPSFFKGVILAADRLTALGKIHLGGEELTSDLVDEIFQVVSGDCRIYNGYGPTEASINCAIFEADNEALAKRKACATLPIGKATANNSLLVLDKNSQPLPVGVPGELHVGGIGLASHYLNRPDLTAEKFVPHPFSDLAGDRLYKTGDRVRYLADGNILFIERIDHQVKVRGFRIELGEIEAALRQHSGIGDTIVMAREDMPGNKRLVAYLTNNGEPLPTSQLRAFLKERLPDYMMPSAFVTLDAIPITASGKVDRRALPAPEITRRDLEESYVAPRTPEEELIASICAELLGLNSMGVHDDLFNLGCHSLMATRIVARLREAFQIELPLVSVFEKPSVAGLAEEVGNALRIEQRLNILPIRPMPRDREFPLSFAQERLWFLCKLDPNNTSYYIPRALRIRGPLDVDVLERTFTELVRRHEILRTTFPLVDGRPVQLIHPPKPFVVSRADLRGAPEKEARVEQIILEQGQRPFDLECDLMLRVAVLRLAELEYVMILTEHHLVHDGWTQGVLVRDFLEVYAAFAAGKASPLPEPTLQYADFAYWQRHWLQGEVLETQLAYWARQLAGAPSFLELPVDHPRPPVQSFKGAEQTLIIDRELAELLRGTSRRQGVTLFMTMFAAFNTLLYRYTSREDILVGTGIANRRWSEIENLLGMIINTLVLRTGLSPDLTFQELLQRVRAVCLQAYAHQDLPFEKVVEELKPERSLSYNPIFQVMFSFMDAPTRELRLPGLALEVINAHNRSAKFDLNIVVIPHTEQLIGQAAGAEPSEITVLWEYSTDIFDHPTIARMLCHFERLLRAAATNVAQSISEMPLLTAAEHRQIVSEWNDARACYPQDKSLDQLFEIQVDRANDAIAVVYQESHFTFLQLNQRANQLAHYLRFLGLGPEWIAAICLERSADFIIAILAVLKAGGTYLPLDPAYPKDRLAFMVDDSQAAFLITNRLLLDRFDRLSVQLICLDADQETISSHRPDNLRGRALTDNAAYVIYTSGSTGTPKGMVISHYNVARLFAATVDGFHFDDRDVWTLFHSFAFDFSVWELWGGLLYGGRLVIVPHLVSRLPDAFLGLLGEQRVTILNQTPSAFAQLSQEALSNRSEAGLALRAVIFGGEALEIGSLQSWVRRFRDVAMVNMYGITETTVHVTQERLSDEDIMQAGGSLIGRPIADLQVYILDWNQAPVPVGVAGEMYVGGEGVGRGYLRRAELTAERMVPDPFSRRGGARLYRSGDLGKHRADGKIEYLGRSDQQVKVRGFRIEPAEIEAALTQHDAVSQAAVVVRRDPPADKRLVAYVVIKPPHDLSAGELRDYLKQKLPDYMIPAAFMRLPALPLTANGKLDRKALPAADAAALPAAKTFQPPRTAVELALAEVWADTLHLSEVGITDNFFDLGGDSILSIKALSLARQRGLDFSLQQLFRHQRISELAQVLSQHEAPPQVEAPSEPFSLISPADRDRLGADIEDAYPLTRLQTGMIFHSIYNLESALYHNSLSLHLEAPFDREKLERAAAHLVRRHAVLRTSFDLTGFSEPLQLVHRTATVSIEINDLRGLSFEEQEKSLDDWMERAKAAKFNLDQAPLLRLHIHRRSDQQFQFTQVEHHAILDGWSVALMLTELFRRYLSDAAADEAETRPGAAFKDYVAMERKSVESVEQREAWLEMMKGSTVMRLPRWQRDDRGVNRKAVRQLEVDLMAEINRGLRQLARQAAVPVKSVLLAAHLKVMTLLGSQEEVLTGLVTNGRAEVEGGDRVLGLFVNTLPLRIRLGGGTWEDLARAVFDKEREVMWMRRYPLQELQKIMGGKALFETAFNYVHFHVRENLEGVKNLRVLGVKTAAETNFTLMVHFSVDMHTEEIRLRLDYDAEELSEAQMHRISNYYRSVLEEMSANPLGRYEEFAAFSAGEEQAPPVEISERRAAGALADQPSAPYGRLDPRANYVPPATAVEETVAGIWAETLSVDRVGVHDNFFDLGGDSLLAVRVGSRVREALKIDAPLQSLFEAPTVRGFCDSMRQAAREQRGVMAAPITPVPRQGHLPLSFTQQRMWFAEQLALDSPLYNVTVAMHIEGPLDVEVLERSFAEVIRRHETLRTKIVVLEGQPSQIVCDPQPFSLKPTDLSALPLEERDAEVQRTLREQARQPFDLSQGTLFRVNLLRLSGQHHLIALSIHHIVSDRWSLGILFRDVSALYESYSRREPASLPELSVQYIDFAVWQRNRAQEEALEKHLPYWQARMGGAFQLLDLPAVRPRPSVPSYRGGRVPLVIGKRQAEALKHLARRNNVTLFMALLAAFKTLLCRYTGQEEILVGSPVANRNRLEVENLIGLFVNTLMLKTDLSGGPSFEEVLRREKEVVLGALAHQEVHFEKLMEALRPELGMGGAPLLQVMFVLQNVPMPALTLTNLIISPIQSDVATAEFDITLSLTETNEALLGVLDYSTDLFDESIINRMAGHFQVLLDSVATQANQPISSLPLLSQAERNEILSDWNNTAAHYEHGVALHRLFEAQVARAPDTIAVVSEPQRLSYAELNRRANRLAHHLQELGVGPDVRVGVGVEPSLEMIVGLLGVLKAGGAYVPLDPEYPQERLAFMMADADMKGLLTQRRFSAIFPSNGLPVVYLDGESEALNRQSSLNPATEVNAENLAYVIYTSGSTGQAKGVMVPHSGVVNTLSWRMTTYSLTGTDRILQNIPFTFDPAVWQIFGALLSGASLILPRPDGHKESDYLTRLMAEQAITITDFPPSVLKVLLAEPGLNECKNLRTIFCGGESLPVDVQDRFFAVLRAQLFNQYGPTETTIDATYWECRGNGGRRRVPIGRPIANAQVYLLDPHFEAVPIGISGELYIGGAGVSRGYLNRADLTAERFIPNLFADQSGARLYKTGDLARYLEAGDIEFLGRIDSQVKIRGTRVEIGEVQAALSQYAGITDAVVVAREDGQGDKQLVAYVAADRQSPLTDFELRAYLRGRLPEFMLPSHFVILEKLPYTATGKLDHRALPAPLLTRAGQQAPYMPPRTSIEERLIAIWGEILRADRVGIQDNFFSAGGHSLMSMQLMSQVRKTFGVDLSLRSFFARPTVEGLAVSVEEAILAKSSADNLDALLDMLEGSQEGDLPA